MHTLPKSLALLLLLPLTQLPAQTAPAPVTPTKRITLFNGKDLTGWTLYLGTTATVPATAPASQPAKGAPPVHTIADNVLSLNTKSAGYLLTDSPYANYKLHVEWRYPKDAVPRSNSGILLHVNGPAAIWPACFEAQLQSGNAGQLTGMGLDIPDAPMQNNRKRAAKLPTAKENPLGQWNTYDITCKADTITLAVNGNPANHITKLPASSGHIGLQMEGFPIDFQNIYIEPLPEEKP